MSNLCNVEQSMATFLEKNGSQPKFGSSNYAHTGVLNSKAKRHLTTSVNTISIFTG